MHLLECLGVLSQVLILTQSGCAGGSAGDLRKLQVRLEATITRCFVLMSHIH
jgi:hypothetical protein